MINFSPTTKHSLRLGPDASDEDKVSNLNRLREGLQTIDDNTERVEVSTVQGAPLTMSGILGGYQFTKEGFASLCSKLSPNTFGLLKGIENADMGADNKTQLQTEIFNKLWSARSHELDDSMFLVDSRTNKIEAVHSSSYGYVSNVEALDLAMGSLSSEETLEYYKVHGRSIDIGISDPQNRFSVPTKRAPDGEAITAIKYLQNSEDGHRRFLMGLGLYTFICTNGMRVGKEFNIVDAVHRSNIVENVRHQLRSASEYDLSGVFAKVRNSTQIQLTDELRGKSLTFLKDRIGARSAKQYLSDDVAFQDGEVPTVYEVFSAMTEDAHSSGISLDKQQDLETAGFAYMDKFTPLELVA
jgi:hypothetical protein